MAGTMFEVTIESSRILAMLSSLGDKTRWLRALRSVVAVIGVRDIIRHFDREQGPSGDWPPLNEAYEKWKRKKGKTRMLQFTGRLRGGFLPGNIRNNDSSSISLFNPVSYSGKHDRGEDGVPERKFMWLSGKATEMISSALTKAIVEGR